MEVRCTCGQTYHADPAHAGRSIRCRCGRTLTVPAEAKVKQPKTRRRRIWRPAASPARRFRFRFPFRFGFRLPPRVARRVPLLVWGYLGLVVGLTALMWGLGDSWWPASILLFGPRWALLIPAVPLGIVALSVRPRLLVPVIAATLIAFGPFTGFRLSVFSPSGGESAGRLRIITFNVEGRDNPHLTEVPARLAAYHADILVFQECPEILSDSTWWDKGWSTRFTSTFCIATRFPILEARELEQVETEENGGAGFAAFYRIGGTPVPIDLAVIHLETPRKGLESLRYRGSNGKMGLNLMMREVGARRVSHWIARQTPDAIIAGDFNMPVESRIYRDNFGDCANAFNGAGSGFGQTRVMRWFRVRIDHVVTCGKWKPVAVQLGPDLGSDHLPLIVDLVRPR